MLLWGCKIVAISQQEKRVSLLPPLAVLDSSSTKQCAIKQHSLSFLGERGQCILSTPPKILFCDLRLDPGESKSCE